MVSAERQVRAAAAAVQQPDCAAAAAGLAGDHRRGVGVGLGGRAVRGGVCCRAALRQEALQLPCVHQQLYKLVDLDEFVLLASIVHNQVMGRWRRPGQ
jgi:hypothetical protein